MMKSCIHIIIVLLVSQSVQSCSLLASAGLTSQGQPIKERSVAKIPETQPLVDHALWNGLLKKYVSEDGLVDYEGFLDERETLRDYLQMLSEHVPSEDWSTAELLAYYINTYNAYTVDLILKNYPVQSIKDIHGAWTKPLIPIGDKKLSLGGIENGVLRKMNEPRIHFAINCASFSCPNLLNEAYTADNIEFQLERVTRAFINSTKNRISESRLELSQIFNWYQKDFTVNGKKDLVGFINQYTIIAIDPKAQIAYLEYNWSLNQQQ